MKVTRKPGKQQIIRIFGISRTQHQTKIRWWPELINFSGGSKIASKDLSRFESNPFNSFLLQNFSLLVAETFTFSMLSCRQISMQEAKVLRLFSKKSRYEWKPADWNKIFKLLTRDKPMFGYLDKKTLNQVLKFSTSLFLCWKKTNVLSASASTSWE